MDFIDSKYIGLVSSRLQKFKKVKVNLYNFRCPLCGDSKKNKNRARGYFYSTKNNTNFKCHNCGVSFSFNNFLKSFDSVLHREYIFEKFKEGHTGKGFVVDTPKFDFNKPIFRNKIDLPKASDVPEAKKYLEDRKVDPDQFYFAKEFKKWVNTNKKVFDDISKDEKRIVIPMYDFDKNLIGYQGRSLEASPNKYITVMLIENAPKIYGLDKVNLSKTIYVVEGPFDSTFIDNSVAMCGSDIDLSEFNWKDYVYVYDNEPRNLEIVNRISKVIGQGYKVVIWPSYIKDKDINNMVLSDLNVQEVLEASTYQGLEAKLKFTHWKKV
jgi:transcription elongation factor Elf1